MQPTELLAEVLTCVNRGIEKLGEGMRVNATGSENARMLLLQTCLINALNEYQASAGRYKLA